MSLTYVGSENGAVSDDASPSTAKGKENPKPNASVSQVF